MRKEEVSYKDWDTKDAILDIFKTDSRTLSFLEKRKDELDDKQFIEAALGKRPSNAKLKAFIHILKSKPVEEEVEEVVKLEKTSNTFTIDSLRDIFCNDTGTLKRINKNYDKSVDGIELIDIALKARPKNKKVLELKHNLVHGETEDESNDSWDAVDAKLDKPTFDPEADEEEMVTTPAAGKYDNTIIGEVNTAKEIGKVKAVEETFNVRQKLQDIFSTDKGTLKAIIKKISEDLGDDDLIEMCLSRRPKNAKLKVMMKEFADFREDEDDVREFDDDETIVSDEQVRSYMKVDSIPYVQNDDKNLTMFINGEMEVINDEHPNFKKIITCLEESRFNDVLPLLDLRIGIASLVYKQLEFKNDVLYHSGKPLDGALVDFIVSMVHNGETDIQPFMRFLHKLLKNPSKRAQKELYGFLSSGKIPINERGNILTYKRIREDWTDCHSGKFYNGVGETVAMERGQVDDRQDVTCSQGLHVCSYSYLSSFDGGRTVVCEVNPVDVVSIPTDYHNAKMRCCKYTVLKEVKNNGSDVLSEKPIYF